MNGQPSTSSTDLPRFEPKKSLATMDGRPPSMLLGKSKETSDITMGGTVEAEDVASSKMPDPAAEQPKAQSLKGADKIPAKVEYQRESETAQRPNTSSGWLGGWLGRPATAETQNIAMDEPVVPANKPSESPLLTEEQTRKASTKLADVSVSPEVVPKSTPAPPVSTSWFGLWSTAAPSTAEKPKEQIPAKLAETDQDTVMEDAAVVKPIAQPTPGSSWAFWTTDPTKKPADPSEEPKATSELAVTVEASENNPERANAAIMKGSKKGKSVKRGRPQSTEIDDATKKSIQVQLDPTSSKATPSQSPTPAKSAPANLLIPSVKSTYRLVESPSILQQIARLIIHGQQQPSKHVFLVKEPPKIKKALAIGIHGLFPAPLLRTVIGQPTGTSIRFANHGAAAIRRWGDQHGCVDCEIEKVALEGEGKIGERVDNLWKLLLNWIDHVRNADFILVSCHSQGVPVAIMLVAKLVEFGVVTHGRIGVCAMGKLTCQSQSCSL